MDDYDKQMKELQARFDQLIPEQKEEFIRDFDANFEEMAQEAIKKELQKRLASGKLTTQ